MKAHELLGSKKSEKIIIKNFFIPVTTKGYILNTSSTKKPEYTNDVSKALIMKCRGASKTAIMFVNKITNADHVVAGLSTAELTIEINPITKKVESAVVAPIKYFRNCLSRWTPDGEHEELIDDKQPETIAMVKKYLTNVDTAKLIKELNSGEH